MRMTMCRSRSFSAYFKSRWAVASLAFASLVPSFVNADDWDLDRTLTEYKFAHKGKPVARYRWKDGDTRRPFFFHLHAPDGSQVTRNHPPIAGKDATDHDTMHPGLWLSFGDVNGQDYWRNKARVWKESEGIKNGDPFSFSEHLVLFNKDEMAEEGQHTNSFQFEAIPEGYLLTWTARFRGQGKDLVFGDQEEMGLGVRMHTDLTEKAGGKIMDSEGRTGAKAIWGKAAKWCAYYRTFAEKGRTTHRGVAIFTDPGNFRPCWWHVRDYGLMVANPFGRRAFTKGDASRVVVKKGEDLTLRFGVLVFSQDGKSPRIEEGYKAYLKRIAK